MDERASGGSPHADLKMARALLAEAVQRNEVTTTSFLEKVKVWMAEEHAPMKALVLAVDDHPAVLEQLLKVLPAVLQVKVDTAPSAEAALLLIENETYDLLIVDLNLPGMTGMEMIERVRKSKSTNARVPILVISGHDVDIFKISGKARANAFLQKPYEVAELVSTIRRLLQYVLPVS